MLQYLATTIKIFLTPTGYFTLPVTCLVEPEPSRLLRPVDPVFVDTLKSHMKRNPSRDVTPIVGLVQLADGEEFQEDKKIPTCTRHLEVTTREWPCRSYWMRMTYDFEQD